MNPKDLARMFDWLVWAVICYAAAMVLRTYDIAPMAQTVLWKIGNVTVGAYVGYWIDRRAFRTRIDDSATSTMHIRRAIIIAAAILAIGLGL